MDSLASDIHQSQHHQLIQDLISNPTFKQLIHKEIIEQQHTIQMGTGIPLLLNEIYQSIDTIVTLKLKQTLNQENVSWMEERVRVSKEIEDIRVQISEGGKSVLKIDTARSFELDKLMEDKSIIVESGQGNMSLEIENLRKEIGEIKVKLESMRVAEPKEERQSLGNFEINPRSTEPRVSKSKERKRTHSISELNPLQLKSSLKTGSFDKEIEEAIGDSIKQKFSNYQTKLSSKYDGKIDQILKSLRFLEGTVERKEKVERVKEKSREDEEDSLTESAMMRIDSSRSFYSRKSTKPSTFASRLIWK